MWSLCNSWQRSQTSFRPTSRHLMNTLNPGEGKERESRRSSTLLHEHGVKALLCISAYGDINVGQYLKACMMESSTHAGVLPGSGDPAPLFPWLPTHRRRSCPGNCCYRRWDEADNISRTSSLGPQCSVGKNRRAKQKVSAKRSARKKISSSCIVFHLEPVGDNTIYIYK